MTLEPGTLYLHNRKHNCPRASVRRLISVNEETVEYEYVYGPMYDRLKHGPSHKLLATQKTKKFIRWADRPVAPGEDYTKLDGCRKWETFLAYSTTGEPIFRCGEKKAHFYLRKGYAVECGDHEIRFLTDTTENKLASIHNVLAQPFWMEVKNNHCCVCGQDYNLNRHHVVPKRHKAWLPQEIRKRLSNVLFICVPCHKHYETFSYKEPVERQNPIDYVLAWGRHFLETMKPKHLPVGWSIFSIDPYAIIPLQSDESGLGLKSEI